jgi:hypothetical protein
MRILAITVVGLILMSCQVEGSLPEPFQNWSPVNHPKGCGDLDCVIVQRFDDGRFAICPRSIDTKPDGPRGFDLVIGGRLVCRHGANDGAPLSEFPGLMRSLPTHTGKYCIVATCALKPKGAGN